MTWYCAVVGTRMQIKGHDAVVDMVILPFGVEARNGHEAVGMADAVMKKAMAARPDFTRWLVQVNEFGEAGLVTDPETVSFPREEKT